MSLTKESAWLIFESQALGQEQGQNAIKNMVQPEFEAYQCWVEDFELALAKVGVAAQNEAAALTENNIELQLLDAKPRYEMVAEDYRTLVGIFEGSKYEKLHLAGLFRVSNSQLLLNFAKGLL